MSDPRLNLVLLRKENLKKLLMILRDNFPIWYSEKDLIKKINLKIFNVREFTRLEKEELLESNTFEGYGNVKFYRISKKGIEFVNSLDSYDLNQNIHWLNKIIIWVGVSQLFLVVIQILISLFNVN